MKLNNCMGSNDSNSKNDEFLKRISEELIKDSPLKDRKFEDVVKSRSGRKIITKYDSKATKIEVESNLKALDIISKLRLDIHNESFFIKATMKNKLREIFFEFNIEYVDFFEQFSNDYRKLVDKVINRTEQISNKQLKKIVYKKIDDETDKFNQGIEQEFKDFYAIIDEIFNLMDK